MYTHAHRSCTHVKDAVVQATIQWIIQFSSVRSLDRLGQENVMDDSIDVLFRSSLQEAFVSSGMGRDVHSLMLSIQDFLLVFQ